MKKFLLLHLFLLLIPAFPLKAQYLENPSFEGPVGLSLVPPLWLPYDSLATPDTEPLDCDTFRASHGNSYLTLVSHGIGSSWPGVNENCQARLQIAFLEGQCYELSVDLASRDDLGHYQWGSGFIFYREEIRLKIFGSIYVSEKGDLLAESGPVSNTGWQTFSFILKPERDMEYLLLEVSPLVYGEGNGNLLVDNLMIHSMFESRVVMNDTVLSTDLPITLLASESPSYSWNPDAGLSCYDCRSPEVNSNIYSTYICSILNDSTLCPEEEIFMLTFNDAELPILPQDFKIPNIFTPNGDLVNDAFQIRGLPSGCTLSIFNRSGTEVFSSKDYKNDWEGFDMEGNPLSEGNYYYIVIIPGYKNPFKGNVYLKRQ